MGKPVDLQQISVSDLRKYRTELPNLYDEMKLSVYEFRLLAHYCRVGNCWESVRTTAETCQMSHPMVIKARTALVKKGLIHVEETTTPKGKALTITVIDIWAKNFAKFSGHTVEQVVTQLNKGGHDIEHGGHTVELKKEPIKKEQIKKQDDCAFPDGLNTPAFVYVWKQWIEYREERKKKLTPSTAAAQLKKLDKLGPLAAAATIEQSIEQGWIGLFPLKDQPEGNGRPQHITVDPSKGFAQ